MNFTTGAHTCRDTLAIQMSRVLPFDINGHGTLFGGKLMEKLDRCASISVSRHMRGKSVTASVDNLNFLRPILMDHALCIKSYISGVGTTSMEVFLKVLGEDLETGEQYLAATSFFTFVSMERDEEGNKIQVPNIIPESEEEKYVCSGYDERRRLRMLNKTIEMDFVEALTVSIP